MARVWLERQRIGVGVGVGAGAGAGGAEGGAAEGGGSDHESVLVSDEDAMGLKWAVVKCLN